MGKDIYMPLIIGDWIKGTRTMKAQVKGVYIGLLLHQYDNGYIPADMDELALIEPEVGLVWDKLKHKFQEFAPGKLLNKKNEEVKDFWNKQRNNGKKGGRPPKKNPKHNPNPIPIHNPNNNLHNDDDVDSAFTVVPDYENPKGGLGEKIEPVETLATRLSKDQFWLEQAAMKISGSIDLVKSRIEKFKTHLYTQKIITKTESEFLSHFFNWNLKQNNSNGAHTKNSTSRTGTNGSNTNAAAVIPTGTEFGKWTG